jgi:hypothetical protein
MVLQVITWRTIALSTEVSRRSRSYGYDRSSISPLRHPQGLCLAIFVAEVRRICVGPKSVDCEHHPQSRAEFSRSQRFRGTILIRLQSYHLHS